MSGSKTAVVFTIAIIMLSITCFITPAFADSYSITQNSKYKYSTENTPFEAVGIHNDISAWSDPDLANLRVKMNNSRWNWLFHDKNEEVKISHFTDKVDKSDIHFHAGHGFYIPLPGFGGHLELYNHPFEDGRVNADTVMGKWNHCKWFNIHSCHVFEDTNWANVLKRSNTHGLLGFGSTTYTTGHFLSDYGEKITKGWTLAKAWEKTSYDQFKDAPKNIVVRTFFKNFDQYLNDKLNAPSTNTTEDIVMCDTSVTGIEEKDIVTKCTFLQSGRKVIINQNGKIEEEITKRVNGRLVPDKIPYNEYKRNEEL